MAERVRYEGVVHWVQRVKVRYDSRIRLSTAYQGIRFFCTGVFHLEESAEFVRARVDCMTCLVKQARDGVPYVRFR